MRHKAFGYVTLMLLSLVVAEGSEETSTRAFPLPGHGTLELLVPASWKEALRQDESGQFPVIEFSPAAGDAFLLQVAPVWSERRDPEFNALGRIRKTLEGLGQESLKSYAHSEPGIALTELGNPETIGFYYSLTDPSPRPGGFGHMTQGSTAVGDLVVTFVMFSAGPEAPERQAALDLIRSIRQVQAVQTAPATPRVSLRRMTFPGKPWSLVLDAGSYTFKTLETKPDGSGISTYGEDKASGMILSIFLEKAAHDGDARACREYYWKRAKKSPFRKKDVTFSERGEMALVEYLTPSYQGVRIDHKNVNAYLSNDGIWVDIHLSKTQYKPEDAELFEKVLKSVMILGDDTPSTAAGPMEGEDAAGRKAFLARDYASAEKHYRTLVGLNPGSWSAHRWLAESLYYQEKYREAAPEYEKALELGARSGALQRMEERLLTDQVGMAYGLSGQLEKARTIFERAIKKDPDYALYYFNLACCHAELGDLDAALMNLKLGFDRRANMLPGETYPDPRTDDSFKSFLGNPKFEAAMKEMGF